MGLESLVKAAYSGIRSILSLAGYNPPPKDMLRHTDKCYRAARRMMSDVLSIIGW